MSTVPFYIDFLGKALTYKKELIRLGNLETKLLSFDLTPDAIDKPIFVSGLARSGSTILLEILASHPDVSTHQYRDYPFVHVHYFWRCLRYLIPSSSKKSERPHQDGLMVNAHSPEAFDEILWTSFFDELHKTDKINILGAEINHTDFEVFYKNNIKKTLYMHKTQRFASKNNYALTRLKYLKKIFPEARFLIPVRSPEAHIASLVKQHTLFLDAGQRERRYVQRTHHYEFGHDFRPINVGDTQALSLIMDHWQKGEYTLAYAHYWRSIHEFIITDILSDPDLKESVHIVRYDDLCENSSETLEKISLFCDLDSEWSQKWEEKLSAPDYYVPQFLDDDLLKIREITDPVKALLWEG